jgi:hypothetical protein
MAVLVPMTINDLIATEAAATEQTPDAEIKPGSSITRGHSRAKTLQVRLNDDELAALTLLAQTRGIPVSTLARDLLLAHLSASDTSTKSLIARIRAELETLASSVA